MDISDVWVEFKATGSPELRNRLVVQYAPLVKYVAGRLRSGLPQNVDSNDLVSEGVFGLMDAIEKFDTERGLEFQTYAVPRIKGAMIDALRSQDWVPRSVREKLRAIEKAHAVLVERFGRTPTEEEIAAELGITPKALNGLYAKVAYTSIAAMEDLVVVDEAPAPGAALEDDAVKEALLRHVRDLRERDQIIVALYYYEGFTLAEIGQVLAVTESRVSQLHTRAMLALRGLVQA
uniref:FliA/WhiG family RNA polymerase sigma factor n=1 Tax=Sporichthya sp. TaxID=65475 RepID=UPI00180C3373